MKDIFVVEQKPFLLILSSMQSICTKRTTIDATSLILFQLSHNELVLKSTDLEISLQSSYVLKDPIITNPRSFLVSGKRIFEIVKELEGEITFTLIENALLLSSGTVRLSLNIKDPEEFPPFPERIENLMQFDSTSLMEMFNKVGFLIPQNNTNPGLNGLFLEISAQNCTMTATDGHCLVQALTKHYTLSEEKKWLLPRRAVFELKKIIEGVQDKHIFLGVCNNQLVFSGESFNFFTKLLADKFPQYCAILDKSNFTPAVIERSSFVKTLRRSACLLSGQFMATHFNFQKNIMTVSMNNKEVGSLEETLYLKDNIDSDVSIKFYAPYLLSGLQVFGDNNLRFYLYNTTKPIIFESENNDFSLLYLVMPVAQTNG